MEGMCCNVWQGVAMCGASGGHPSAFLLHFNQDGYSQQRGGAVTPRWLREQE